MELNGLQFHAGPWTVQNTYAEIRRHMTGAFRDIFMSTDTVLRLQYRNRCQRMLTHLAQSCIKPQRRWRVDNANVCATYAALSGILCVFHVEAHRHEHRIQEIMPFLPIEWHASLAGHGTKHIAADKIIQLICSTCTDEGQLHQGIQYLLIHKCGSRRYFYPGSCKMLTEGRAAGRPRWPQRCTEHASATMCPGFRDYEVPRYRAYRTWGEFGLYGMPVYVESHACAYSREMFIIRTTKPPTTGKHNEEFGRGPRARHGRERPPLWVRRVRHRRLERQNETRTRFPPLAENFNNSTYTQKIIWRPDYRPRVANYRSMYHHVAMAARSGSRQIAAPINISAKGNERLLTEFAATPGSRLDTYMPALTTDQLRLMGIHSQRVTGPYRAKILLNKLSYLLPQRGVPAPRQYRFKVPESLWHLATDIRRLLNNALTVVKRRRPRGQVAQYAQRFTQLQRSRDQKLADALVNEQTASKTFATWKVEFIPREVKDALIQGVGSYRALRNIDIPQYYTSEDTETCLTREMLRWMQHFSICIPPHQTASMIRAMHFGEKAEASQFARLSQPLHREARRHLTGGEMHNAYASDIEKHMNTYGMMINRLDHDAHAILIRPNLAYWCILEKYYLKDTKTFTRLNISIDQAIAEIRTTYFRDYPHAFVRHDTQFDARSIPRAVMRPKKKCYSEHGLSCEKPDHCHERLVVDTTGLPNRWSDKLLGKTWQILKRSDNLPSWELWGLQELFQEHRKRRARLKIYPEHISSCLRCRKAKDLITLLRIDCSAMYTRALIADILKETPRVLWRVARKHGTNTVTLDTTVTQARGHVGGAIQGRFRRFVATHAQLWQYMKYHCAIRTISIGEEDDRVLIRQNNGVFMGGRASKIQTSILLGAGEGRLQIDEAKRRRLGFWKEHAHIDWLISNIRYVDDDPVASTVFCGECCLFYVQTAWGAHMGANIEEESTNGSPIKFLDCTERREGLTLILKHRNQNITDSVVHFESPEGITRYVPFPFHPYPHLYLRGLITGAVTRARQIAPHRCRTWLIRLMQIAYELEAHPNQYPRALLIKTLHSFRADWLRRTARQARTLIQAEWAVQEPRPYKILHTDRASRADPRSIWFPSL